MLELNRNFINVLFMIFILIFGVLMISKYKTIGTKAFLFWQSKDVTYFQRLLIITAIFSLSLSFYLLIIFLRVKQISLIFFFSFFLLLGAIILIFNKSLAIKHAELTKKCKEDYYQILYLISGIIFVIGAAGELFLKNLFKQIMGR